MQFNCCGADTINAGAKDLRLQTVPKISWFGKYARRLHNLPHRSFSRCFFYIDIKTLAADEHACAVRVHSAAAS